MKVTDTTATRYSIGLDYGTSSVRAVIVDVADGRELSSAVANYSRGEDGVMLDSSNPDLARQAPIDYLVGLERVVRQAVEYAATDGSFSPRRVIGIGVDTTGSTPMPVDKEARSLSFLPAFRSDLDAMAWLWK